MSKEEKKSPRPEAYPKPTETDKQLDNQDEFIQAHSDKKNEERPLLKDVKPGESVIKNA